MASILYLGGTGNISAASVRLAQTQGHRITLLNRGQRDPAALRLPPGIEWLRADLHDETATAAVLGDRTFDIVAQFIAYRPADVERDIRLFTGRCGQYFFISSASAYEKPVRFPFITESHPLKNPFWSYSRDKIACEDLCLRAYRDHNFPAIIVRPSHTYDTVWPLAIGGWTDFTPIARLRRGQPLIVHGDGTSLWTLTHSEDFATGFNGLFGHTAAVGHAFHITSDEVLSWNQIYETVCSTVGVPPNLVHIPTHALIRMNPDFTGSLLGDKAHSIIFDNSKIKTFVPGFRATIPFREGCRRTLAWFQGDPARQTDHPTSNTALERYLSIWNRMLAAGADQPKS